MPHSPFYDLGALFAARVGTGNAKHHFSCMIPRCDGPRAVDRKGGVAGAVYNTLDVTQKHL